MENGIKKADIIFVAVNTPTKIFGEGKGFASNVTNLEKAARTIARVATKSKIVVEKSTVPVKTAATIKRVLNASNKGIDFQILSNPEFLAEGTAMKDLYNPSRVLIGGGQDKAGLAAIQKLVEVYANWVPKSQIITTNLWSSELSKLVANAFLAQRISSINSISALCEKTNADVDEVARAIGSDPRIGSRFLRSSVGFGGSCFQKDILNLVYLCKSFGLPEVASYWESVVRMNDYQKKRFAMRIIKTMFNTVTDKKIALLGFAFKKDTGDTRETAAAYVTLSLSLSLQQCLQYRNPLISFNHRYVAKALLEERAKIVVNDPKVIVEDMYLEFKYTLEMTPESFPDMNKCLSFERDVYKAVHGAHCIAVMTEWDHFKTLDFNRIYDSMMKPAFVFDGRNILDHEKLRKIGFEVYAIGKPDASSHLQ